MKRLLLHIGIHKTGTSSIQESLATYEDDQSVYCSAIGINHSIAVTTMFSKSAHRYHIWQKLGLTAIQVEERRKKYFETLETFLGSFEKNQLIISGEDIRRLTPEEKITLLNYFASRGFKTSVVCVVRAPASYAVSALQQDIRGGLKDLRFISPAYKDSLRGFEDYLEPEDIHVEDFESIVAEHGSVVTWFARLANLDETRITEIRSNESISEPTAQLLFRLNKLPFQTFGSQQHLNARTQLTSAIEQKYPRSRFGSIQITIAAHLIEPGIESELRTLRSKYSINYASIQDTKPQIQAVQTYLSSADKIDKTGLLKLIKELDIPLALESTLDEMLYLLYARYLLGSKLTEKEVDYVRDTALRIEKNEKLGLQDAYQLMLIARNARTKGPLIQRKVEEYQSKLQKPVE